MTNLKGPAGTSYLNPELENQENGYLIQSVSSEGQEEKYTDEEGKTKT